MLSALQQCLILGFNDMPTGSALDRADDLVGDVLVNIEAFFGHGGSPFLAARAIAASWGKKGPGPWSRGMNLCALRRAAKRGGAAQAKRGSEPR
jgi:hypothetical protein